MRRNRWRLVLGSAAPESGLASWLNEANSLTARCQQHCREFRVRLLHYGRGRALASEGLLPGRQQLAWIREVALECDGVPVIFAHTSLSTPCRGRLGRWFGRLGNRSLGSLLFVHPGFRRGGIEFLRLDNRHPLFQRAAALGESGKYLWARRSLHRLGRQQVVVTEVFLPAIVGLDKSTDKPVRAPLRIVR